VKLGDKTRGRVKVRDVAVGSAEISDQPPTYLGTAVSVKLLCGHSEFKPTQELAFGNRKAIAE
jgi:hypothetical protein